MRSFRVLDQRTKTYADIDKTIQILFNCKDFEKVQPTIIRLGEIRTSVHELIVKAIKEL